MLDKLLLLSKGHMMYYGEAQAVAEWFQRLGYPMPYGVNSADFILDMASGDVYTKKLDGEESRKHCIECSERYLQHRSHGYLQGGDLSEELLGSELYGAAEVAPLSALNTALDCTCPCGLPQLLLLHPCCSLLSRLSPGLQHLDVQSCSRASAKPDGIHVLQSRRNLNLEPHVSGKRLSSDMSSNSTGSSSAIHANGLEDIEMGRKVCPSHYSWPCLLLQPVLEQLQGSCAWPQGP